MAKLDPVKTIAKLSERAKNMKRFEFLYSLTTAEYLLLREQERNGAEDLWKSVNAFYNA